MKLRSLFNTVLKEEHEKKLITEIVEESFGKTIFGNDPHFIKKSAHLIQKDEICEYYKNIYETIEKIDATDDLDKTLLKNTVLTFSMENQKLGGSVATFSLPAGWTCPFAEQCLVKVERERVIDPEKVGTGKISKKTGKFIPDKGKVSVKRGKKTVFNCYAAMMEMQYDALRANRWRNFDLLKAADKEGGAQAQADLIVKSLEYLFEKEGFVEDVRIHESGDFYNGEYLKAWLLAAQRMPKVKFYAYTKSIPFVKNLKSTIDKVGNFSLTLSQGGRKDDEIGDVDIKASHVFNSPEEALKANLQVDLDDSLAKEKGGKEKSFSLLVHGTQEKGEKSQQKMRNETFLAYWKYRAKLNKMLRLPENYRMSQAEAIDYLKLFDLAEKESEGKNGINYNINGTEGWMAKSNFLFYKKLLNYVVKYYNYNFSENLINIIPEKYRP